MPYVHLAVTVTVSAAERVGVHQVGARMAKLELRKKAAVENEDYDTAKLIKVEMDKLRAGLSYASDPHGGGAGDARATGGGGGNGGYGGHRPANVVIEEEDMRGGGGGVGGESPYVKNPFGNKSSFGGGGPGVGSGGAGHTPSRHSPPPAHNDAYSPQVQGGGYEDDYTTPARGGGGGMRSSSQNVYPDDDKGVDQMGAPGGGGAFGGRSPNVMAQPSPGAGYVGGVGAGGGRGGGDDGTRDPETGMVQGPRRIVDPDAREVRAGPAAGAVVTESTDLSNDKAALAAAQSKEGPGPPDELSGALIAEGEPIAELYGPEVAKLVLSKHWQHRTEGLEEIQKLFNTGGNLTRGARVVAGVLRRAIADKNPTVVLASFQLLQVLCVSARARCGVGGGL
jgi:hypothetical protein